MRILKFGGKSLSTPEKVQNICKFIKKLYKKDKKIIIVVSAMGQTTDNLLSEAKQYYINKPSERELDVLLSIGETKSSALFSLCLNSLNVPAKSFQGYQIELTTFGGFQNGKVAYINKEPIEDCLENNEVAIISGFQGLNKNGEITTLGRGGSDTTASAIGAIFDHDVEIYSDFNGIYCGEPRLYNYKKIKNINYSAMTTLAKSGAKVLDSRAVSIAKKFNFNIEAKSSYLLNGKGTLVSNIEDDIVAISSKDDLCEISIIFTNKSRMKFIIKNVINEINNTEFYNLTINNDKISFITKKNNQNKILLELSNKLKLLQK